MLNPNIIARELGLKESSEISGPGGKPIPVVAVDMTADEAASIYNDIIS